MNLGPIGTSSYSHARELSGEVAPAPLPADTKEILQIGQFRTDLTAPPWRPQYTKGDAWRIHASSPCPIFSTPFPMGARHVLVLEACRKRRYLAADLHGCGGHAHCSCAQGPRAQWNCAVEVRRPTSSSKLAL